MMAISGTREEQKHSPLCLTPRLSVRCVMASTVFLDLSQYLGHGYECSIMYR